MNKLGLHAINGPYPQVGLQCRNKQTNNVHIWYQSCLAAVDNLMWCLLINIKSLIINTADSVRQKSDINAKPQNARNFVMRQQVSYRDAEEY